MRARFSSIWEYLRSSFWFVPTLMVVGAIALALGMLALDSTLQSKVITELGWVYTGGPQGARALLSAVAGSVITVAGTTFSITIAALTLASSQFGPRLLRNFVRDQGNQIVLGTFIATFIYCLLVLRAVRGLEDTQIVPNVSVTGGVLLAIACIGVLIYFIHHIAESIQADYLIALIGRDLEAAIDRLFPQAIGQDRAERKARSSAPDIPAHFASEAGSIPAQAEGYVQVLDADMVLQIATQHNLILRIAARPGQFVIRGSTLAYAWPTEHITTQVCNDLNSAFALGYIQTRQQDIGFVLDQLVEIAVRALSAGINDPFTAMRCIDHIGAALCHLTRHAIPGPYRYDAAGRLRVIAEPVTFRELVDIAFDQIRHYGRSDTAVTKRLLETIAQIATCCQDDEQHAALRRQAEMIWRGSQESIPEPQDRAAVEQRYRAVLKILNHVPEISELADYSAINEGI